MAELTDDLQRRVFARLVDFVDGNGLAGGDVAAVEARTDRVELRQDVVLRIVEHRESRAMPGRLEPDRSQRVPDAAAAEAILDAWDGFVRARESRDSPFAAAWLASRDRGLRFETDHLWLEQGRQSAHFTLACPDCIERRREADGYAVPCSTCQRQGEVTRQVTSKHHAEGRPRGPTAGDPAAAADAARADLPAFFDRGATADVAVGEVVDGERVITYRRTAPWVRMSVRVGFEAQAEPLRAIGDDGAVVVWPSVVGRVVGDLQRRSADAARAWWPHRALRRAMRSLRIARMAVEWTVRHGALDVADRLDEPLLRTLGRGDRNAIAWHLEQAVDRAVHARVTCVAAGVGVGLATFAGVQVAAGPPASTLSTLLAGAIAFAVAWSIGPAIGWRRLRALAPQPPWRDAFRPRRSIVRGATAAGLTLLIAFVTRRVV